MPSTHTVSVRRLPVDTEALGYFRFGKLAGGVILTNEVGQWQHVTEDTFHDLLAGRIDAEHEAYQDLATRGFMRDAVDLEAMADHMRRRKRSVGMGPSLHCIDLGGAEAPLRVEVAKQVLDHVMLSTSAQLTFRVDGRSGHIAADTLAFIVQYATEKNRYEGKTLTYELEVQSAELAADVLDVVTSKGFNIRLHVDLGASPAGLDALKTAMANHRKAGHVELVVHVHEATEDASALLKMAEQVGAPSIHAVPGPNVSVDAFRRTYRAILHDLTHSDAGVTERGAATMLVRATQTDDPAGDIPRSPSSVGTATFAYDVNGCIFPSLDAARAAADGDDLFLIGRVGEISYKETVSHATVRALTMASLLECLPGFQDRWSTPFCGVDPVASYLEHGDMFVNASTSRSAACQHAAAETVFEMLVTGSGDAHARLLGFADPA